jgi:malate dehydrogenase (oxaloacetate-decarboxylating)(NADP+)
MDAKSRIWMLDSGGLIADGREKAISEQKALFKRSEQACKDAGVEPAAKIADVVRIIKPTCLIGAAGQPGVFTKDVLQTMSEGMPPAPPGDGGGAAQPKALAKGDRATPIVLALSNPTDNSECTYQVAWDATGGRVVFAGGSPFPEIDADGGTMKSSQANNALIYPGLGAAAILTAAKKIPDSFFLAAAHALADEVTPEEREEGLVVPPVGRIRDAALAVAARVSMCAVADGISSAGANESVVTAADRAVKDEKEAKSKDTSALKDLRAVIAEWRF